MTYGIAALTVAAVGTAASVYTSEKARKQQKKANKAQERIRQTQSARERMAQVREQRLQQAQVVQGSANMEGTSSTAAGAYSAIGSSTAGNVQFINQIDSLQQDVYSSMSRANRYSAQSGYYAQAANLAMQAAGQMGSPTNSVGPSASKAGSAVNTGIRPATTVKGG